MTTSHLVPHLNLALLCHIDPYHHVGSRGQFIAVLARKHPHIHHPSFLPIGNSQGVIAHIASFFAKDSSQQSLFGGLIRLSFGRYLTHQNIARLHPCANANDAILVQLAQSVFTHIGNFPSDFLRT